MLALKLGQSLVSLNRGGSFEPTNISSLQLWYKNLEGLENQDGETDPDDFINTDKVSWQTQVGSNLLDNAQNWNKPLWNTGKMATNINANKFFELTTPLSIAADFSFVFSVYTNATPNQDGLLGKANLNVFEIEDNNTFAFRAGGATEISITSGSETLSYNQWYTIVLTRDSGTVTVYVDGSGLDDVEWGSGTDSDTFEVETVGSWNGDAQNLNGFIRHLTYFNAALTDKERGNMIDYINNY
mgnify:CR=1 FL=1